MRRFISTWVLLIVLLSASAWAGPFTHMGSRPHVSASSPAWTVGIGAPGRAGFGVGVCPPNVLPAGFTPVTGYKEAGNDNYGNYQYADGSIMVFIPAFYFKVEAGDAVTARRVRSFRTASAAAAAGYVLHRAFIDGGNAKAGFFADKYMCSKNALGTGYVASSVKNGLPISMHPDHNPVADLTACDSNNYYQAINAAHARDGENGAVNASSKFHVMSRFQWGALAMLSLAHGQAATSTDYCAWYDSGGTTNFPKGCNNNALGDVDDGTVSYISDGYDNCGKTGSGTPFAKTTHNGQACGVADMNGLMWEINIGLTCIATNDAIEAMSQTNPCVITITGHGRTTGDFIQVNGITQADWSGAKDNLWQVTVIDPDTFSIDFDASGFGTAYDAGTDPGTCTIGAFYTAKTSTAMADFTSGDSTATDHWGSTGVAAMMEEFQPAFVDGGFTQRVGNGAAQVLSTATSGNDYALACMGFPQTGAVGGGIDLFGDDLFYQYIRNDLCLLSGARWYHGSNAGVWASRWYLSRSFAHTYVGFRAACPVSW